MLAMPALTRRHLLAGAAATAACAALPAAAIADAADPAAPEFVVIGGHRIAMSTLARLGTVHVIRAATGRRRTTPVVL
jgi:hypothetical protein